MLAHARAWTREFAADWGGPIILSLAVAAVVWTVWYFTKAPCTPTAANNGLCNPGAIARFINVEILLGSGGAALAVGALKGGYNRYMMNREREARRQAEQQLAEERERSERQIAEERKRIDELIERFSAGQAENRRRDDLVIQMMSEALAEAREERRQNAATQQAMLDAVLRLADRNGDSRGNVA